MGTHPTAAPAGSYIYCIAPAHPLAKGKQPLKAASIGDQQKPPRIVTSDGLAAVVSDMSVGRFDITRQNILTHERVIAEVMSRVDVLPCSFGTVAASDKAIREDLLRPLHGELLSQLDRIRGHVEMGVMVLWERERLFADITEEDVRIRRMRDAIAAQPQDTAYYDRIALGELVAASIEQRREREAVALLASLQPLAADSRVNRIINDMMILNAAFLVKRDRVPAFDERIRELAEVSAGRLIFRYAGPLAPYNFVDIALRNATFSGSHDPVHHANDTGGMDITNTEVERT
ncbi:MAG TPA: GvpL/GvpF family gas vesicle protein [Ktedonobacterales bacterium]